jgi:type I restriction-modification system DNA methylase subunit
MDDSLISDIQTFTLHGREILEREVDEQLQGIYGWLPDGSFAPTKTYPAVAGLEEARETRQRLERFAMDEKAAGFDANAARTKLKREAAFTWLNRFVAFRLMEEHKLLKQTIAKHDRSNGFIFWLTDDTNKDAYSLHQQGSLPLNAMGEGLSDVAYRRFILWQCSQLARDVSVLFDPATPASRLFPRPTVFKQLIEDMTADALTSAWQPGNEETIGWVYEGFVEDENRAVFEKFSKGKKVLPEEIGPATQKFTPRWIVRFLVENSLGRLWLEMHPDSRLRERLAYLVPDEQQRSHPSKLARDISFLDPCCGSMHFGLLAFDLFVEMYREEIERAGQIGWPDKASVITAEDIPSSIVAYNLHGIDLDMRAVQISALALLLRARSVNATCKFTDRNLASANVEEITGGRFDELIKQAKFSHPIYERILRAVAARLKESSHVGSLSRIEREIERLVSQERAKAEADKQFVMAFPGLSPEQFKTQAGIEEFFELLTDQVLRHLDLFVEASRKAGSDPGHLVNEAAKGLRYLRLVSRHYDVVATNPPYMSRRNMSEVMRKHLEGHYPDAKSDLYPAFICRCVELCATHGKVAMVTQQSFMFISSYEELRERLRSAVAIERMAHLGPKAFPNITGEKVNTTAFIFEKQPDERLREQQIGIYFRLVKEPDADSKRCAFESGHAAYLAGGSHAQVFRYLQKDFNTIPGKPWVYWLPKNLSRLFRDLPLLGTVAKPRQGLATADNARFVRKWWEVGKGNLGFGCESTTDTLKSGRRWFPYMKGGTPTAWYGNQEHVVDWMRDGAAIKSFGEEEGKIRSRPQNTDYYFRRGVTWTDISSKGFAGRLSPGGFIHDVTGMTCFPSREKVLLVLAIFNSRIAEYLLTAINPTIHFQVGDIERLPIPGGEAPEVDGRISRAIELTKQSSRESETTYDFAALLSEFEDYQKRQTELGKIEAEIDCEVSRLYALTEEDLAAVERELSSSIGVASEDGEEETNDEDEADFEVTPESWAQSWISYAVGIVLSRFEVGVAGGLGCGDFSKEAVADLKKLISTDGILIVDAGSERDLTVRVLKALEIMLGESKTKEIIGFGCGEGDQEDELLAWLDKEFWKYHFQLYRKRPVYWPLQSPKKRFTVWVFHERFTKDTLFQIRRNIIEVRLRLLEREIADKRREAATNKAAAKQVDKLRDLEDDLREFSKRLKEVVDRGYTPHIDDGVVLNAAPLLSLLPSWPEAKKAWQELEAGEYDWAQQAMEYWPERVKKKCKTNKSFAIAHGLA